MNYANKMNIPFVSILGEDELSSGKVKIKNMNTGESVEIAIDDSYGIKAIIERRI